MTLGKLAGGVLLQAGTDLVIQGPHAFLGGLFSQSMGLGGLQGAGALLVPALQNWKAVLMPIAGVMSTGQSRDLAMHHISNMPGTRVQPHVHVHAAVIVCLSDMPGSQRQHKPDVVNYACND